MSEDKNNQAKNDQAATQPIKKTSAVPLRKETVRVTLKAPGAKPGGAPSGVEPPAAAKAPAPPAPLAAPTIPLGGAPAAKLPNVTSSVPLKQETMRVTLKADKDAPGAPKAPAPAPAAAAAAAPSAPAPAPTIPLNTGPRPAAATPAPTMKLGGAPTIPLSTPASGSQPLPKATVELQQTQQLTQGLGAPSQAASIQTASADDEAERGGAGVALPLSIVAFVLSLIVLYFQFDHAKIWIDDQDAEIMSIFDTSE